MSAMLNLMFKNYKFTSCLIFANLALSTKSETKTVKLCNIALFNTGNNMRKLPPMNTKSELMGHPIPVELIENIDVFSVKKSGGGKLAIIAAGYLDRSDETLHLLVQKINTYLSFINSQEFEDECGLPTPDNTEITLVCTMEPHPYIFEFVDSLKKQINTYNSSIKIEIKKE